VLILAVETSGDVCSVALADGHGLVGERRFRHDMRLLQRLVPEAEDLLAASGAGVADVGAFAASLGPGSLTGLRIGVATVNAWAAVTQRPAIGVPTLEAVAREASPGTGVAVVAAVRSRYGTVYVGVYRRQEGAWIEAAAPRMVAAADIAAAVAPVVDGSCVLCGDGLLRHGPEMVEAVRAVGLQVEPGSPMPPRAATIAAIAREALEHGAGSPSAGLVPLYVSPPQIGPAPVRTP
jgi:tRNA threonylcarbamoyladenosine biosynthesis protein TsaB